MGRYGEGSCSAAHPWIDRAIDRFFSNAESRSTSGLGLREVIDELRARSWSNHRPGKLEVTLSWSSAESPWSVSGRTVNRPNQPYKPAHMLTLLKRAVRRHGPEIARELGSPGALTLFLQTEDYPNLLPMHAGGRATVMRKWALPVFSMCATADATDVPAPDFTWVQYAESGRPEPWDTARRQIAAAAAWHSPWRERRRALVWRGAMRAGGHAGGPRERAIQRLRRVAPLLAANGVELDVQSVDRFGGGRADRNLTISREELCGAAYLLHLRGTTYSASLRYQLLCGSPVAALLGDETGECAEWFHPALADGRHFVKLPPDVRGQAAALLNLTSQLPAALSRAARIGAAGQHFVQEGLSDDVVDCYWARALVRYGRRAASLSRGDTEPEAVRSLPSEEAEPERVRECWWPCHERAGPCHFCGSRQACCRAGFDQQTADCGFGKLGCEGTHCCVASAPVVRRQTLGRGRRGRARERQSRMAHR